MKFISVAWYKVNNLKRQGIIRKTKDKEKLERYKFHRPTDIGEKNNLILRNVTTKDSGIYECGVNANVGNRNANPQVSLYVSDCVTKPVPTTMKNILNTTQQCSHRVEDLPVVWSVTGYLAVGVIKIILSLIIIWVIRRIGIRSRRHKCIRWNWLSDLLETLERSWTVNRQLVKRHFIFPEPNLLSCTCFFLEILVFSQWFFKCTLTINSLHKTRPLVAVFD